ncbi:hypothetical protein DH2020_037178 [Rehmannia glutinosa]|uniref:Uncharacterized protein n=1 Tax=Rehmannia glutinosa TaxID=99300 RepID=A0ABR0V254_REHGL
MPSKFLLYLCSESYLIVMTNRELNDLMESKGGKKKSSSSKSSLFYEAPLDTALKTFDHTEESRNSDLLHTPTLEISFSEPGVFADPGGCGLRSLSKSQLDEILDPAQCTIVSSLKNDEVDSYIHPWNFHFPGAQLFPHRSFSEEVAVLDNHFTKLGLSSNAYVMGGADEYEKWHVYSACAKLTNDISPVYTLEMCMTNLDPKKASVFFKSQSGSATVMTEVSGIRKILPDSKICDFDFDPCGYSMNSIEGGAISHDPCHPRGWPAKFSVSLHASFGGKELDSEFTLDMEGYNCGERSCEVLGNGGSIIYSSFTSEGLWVAQVDSAMLLE